MLFKSDAVVEIDKNKSSWVIQLENANSISILDF